METSTQTHTQAREILDAIRRGEEKYTDATGAEKTRKRAAHDVNRDVWTTVYAHLISRGEFFRAPQPYYFDVVDVCLVRLAPDDPGLARLLRQLGLLPTEPHAKLVARALIDRANLSPVRPVHRFAFFGEDAIYIRVAETRMLKVTAYTIEEVPLGTDGVLLIADDLGDWPPLSDLQPHIDALRPRIGDACTQIIANTPLHRLTSRWSTGDLITADQQHQMAFTRVLFMLAASRYSLWPIMLLTGDGGSGKTTFAELVLALLKGRKSLVKSLPSQERDLDVSLTNATVIAYDNIDGAGASRDANALTNKICQVSTGAEIDIRKLYADNQLLSYEVQSHCLLTCRVNEFEREDVMRRFLHLQMEPPSPTNDGDRDGLIRAVVDNRPLMLAEMIIRAQNIVRAHAAHAETRFAYTSKMAEYEKFTLICAAYEGTLDETRAIWANWSRQYELGITQSDSLILGLRLWLGRDRKNANRQISPSVLFAELQQVHRETGQPFMYKSPAAFGKRMRERHLALSVLGYEFLRTRSGHDYIFRPSPEEINTSSDLYHSLAAAAFNSFFATSTPRRQETPDYDDVNKYITDPEVIQ